MGWKETIVTHFGRKERSPMFITLVSIILAASLLLGGGGAAVYASQDSLPGEPLYAVKQMSETVRLDLANSLQARLALELSYANRRIEEIGQLAGRGEILSEAAARRYQQQMEAAFHTAAGLDDSGLPPALERLRLALRTQERVLQRVPGEGGEGAKHILEWVRERIQLNLRLVENGLKDPQAFRRQVREGAPDGASPISPGEPGQGAGGCPGCPHPSVTPGPASTAAPQGGPHNSPGGSEGSDEHHDENGAGPQAILVPAVPGGGTGNGEGSGDGDCDGCGAGPHGPQPTALDSGGSHDGGFGSGDGDCDGCGDGPKEPQPPTPAPGGSHDGGSGGGDGGCDGCGDGSGGLHHPEGDTGGHDGGSGERHRP
jgi:hypothetical protein